MKKRFLISFMFLSSFSILAAACGGKTDTTQNKNTSTVAKPEAKKPDASKPTPTQTKTTPPTLTAKPSTTKPAVVKPVVTKPTVATHAAAAKPCESTVSLVPNGKNTLKRVFHICVAPKSDGGSFDLKVKD